MRTRWGRDLDPERVLPEHPRPQLVRESWASLNGTWEHAFTPAGAPEPERYDGPILVPFSPEAPLSGVGRQLRPDETLWYRRTFRLPAGFRREPDDRVLLHLEAVDQTCTVLVNDVEVGRHEGGYWRISLDVTDALRPGGNVLVVAVRDLSDGHQHASGKQRLDRGAIWYTAQSGIWQTVWLEAVPPLHVERLELVPHLDLGAGRGELEVTVHARGDGAAGADPPVARVAVAGREVEAPIGRAVRVAVEDVRPWSPEDPHLYDVGVTLGRDHVSAYAGMRSVAVGEGPDGVPRLLLNGEPRLQVGVLDQGYWPDGLMTAPSDEALVHDITTMKDLGFTMLRKHIKVESARWYHHCDRLGMLVWQDAVNGGGPYSFPHVASARRGRRSLLRGGRRLVLDDTGRRARRRLGRADAAGRALFRRELEATMTQLQAVPSIVAWVPFNEGWGQFDAATVAAEVARRDPTRLVDHASGWHDQGAGDLWSIHVYREPVVAPDRRRRERRALVLSEYGGVSLAVPGHVLDEDVVFGHGSSTTPDEWLERFTALHDDEVVPAVRAGVSAVVYTQLSDVEDEVNGLLTYDREHLKADPAALRAVLSRLTVSPGPW